MIMPCALKTAETAAHLTCKEFWHATGVPLEEISRLVGHSSTAVTELVYRKQIRPVLQQGATAMDRLFSARSSRVSHSHGG